MSLRVWLPLNGDLRNQGLSNVTVTNNGATVNTSGKIGSCYEFNNSKNISLTDYVAEFLTYTNWSISLWFKCTALNTAHTGSALISSGNWNAATLLLQFSLGYFSSDHYTKLLITNANYWYNGYSYNFYLNTWYHVVLVSGNNKMSAYVNGELIGDSFPAYTPVSSKQRLVGIGKATYSSSMPFYGLMNDVRIYDHALSAKEVEEIAKGLVLHYKLDTNLNVLNNCYDYPTFNISSSNGGWQHWGASGHAGNYGQNTNKSYIFNSNQTYSHWFANGSSATKDYLLYLSPAFNGGYRSLLVIIKEENSLPITENIVYPSWNGRNGGVPLDYWTSIISLGNGFYLCKCEGISLDGSNNLIGIYIRPGYKVYVSEAYVENNREICSDIFNQNNLITIYDSSGYGNNGTITGSLTIVTPSPKYSVATHFECSAPTVSNNVGLTYIKSNFGLTTPVQMSVCWWARPESGYNDLTANAAWCTSISASYPADYNYTAFHHRDGKFDICLNNDSTTSKYLSVPSYTKNEWHHYSVIYNGTIAILYQDGIEVSRSTISSTTAPLKTFTYLYIGFSYAGSVWRKTLGSYSDFRIYATALTEAQIKELYNTSMSIDNSGNIHARELVEL